MNLGQFSKSDWRRITLGAVLIAGVAAGGVAWTVSAGNVWATVLASAFGALLVGPLVLLLGSVNVKLNNLLRRVNETEDSLREMVNIRPLLDGPPLDYGGWAMDPHLGKVLSQVIARHTPDCVVECGSGTSTVLMARCLKRHGTDGEVIAFDHLDRFASRTRLMLEHHGVDRYGRVVTAPLEEWALDNETKLWYGVDLEQFDQEFSIDLLVVDGPPADTGEWARYPALPILGEYLSDQGIVVLDDGKREDESDIAEKWARIFDMEKTYLSGGTGTWILQS